MESDKFITMRPIHSWWGGSMRNSSAVGGDCAPLFRDSIAAPQQEL